METATQFGYFTVQQEGGVSVVRFTVTKILDEQMIQDLGADLLKLVDSGCHKLIVSFAGLEFMSSAFLGKLITLQKKVQNLGGKQVLCEIRPEIHETFEITKLDQFFTIVENDEAALAKHAVVP
jgi:anti-sigma B factor antagonist